MSRNKAGRRILLVLAALLLLNPVVLASEPQDIIDLEQMASEQTAYTTTEVKRGSLIQEFNFVASKYYPLTYDLCFEQDNAKFVEYTVENGAEVKKGDVLARFSVSASEAEFTRLKLDLQRTEEETADGIREREQDIEKKRAELSAAGDEYEKKILELTIKKLTTELAQYKLQQQRSIDQKREAYNEEYARRTTDVLVSPVDGVVRNLTHKTEGDVVLSNEVLVTVSSGESMLLSIVNELGNLRYNMPVEVRIGDTENPVTVTGRIVAADDAVPKEEKTWDENKSYVLVQLDSADEETAVKDKPRVSVQTVRLDDVLMISESSATQVGSKYYVTKLTDGMVQKRYVELGVSCNQSVWVLAGAEEGETLILD